MQKSDTEYKVLKILEANPNLTQRQMAKDLNVSLGKTNYVIRALIEGGWVKLNNFKRHDHKMAYIYLLTPQGVAQKARLAKMFLNRKLLEYNKLKEEIEMLKRETHDSVETN